MLKIAERTHSNAPPDVVLALPFDLRSRSRQRVVLDDGQEAALILPRGQILRGGDRLLADDGRVVEVRAAPEQVSTVSAKNAVLLLRVAYHLGNRHVALEVQTDHLRYLHDKVLDDMVRGMGASVEVGFSPFEPEGGAYTPAVHGHGHADAHDHAHAHEHPHSHG